MNPPAEPVPPASLPSVRGLWLHKVHWALRALVVTSLSIQLLVDLYHFLEPSSVGIPSWVFPLVIFSVFMGPISVIWLVLEASAVLVTQSKKGPLLVDAALVAIWSVIWFAHL